VTRPKPYGGKAKAKREALRRGVDFQAGIHAARAAIAPLIMRRYFLRGMLAGVGVALTLGVGSAWALIEFGFAVLDWRL
jgi:hypothetical protein